MSAILFLVGAICAAIASLLGFGVFSGAHLLGWLAAAVFFIALAAAIERVPRTP